jgi:ElaB/YqjD/DUF883 family membrane-anchored ribosome-binding protein
MLIESDGVKTPWWERWEWAKAKAMSNTLHELGQDASKLAHERLIDPAKDLIQDAKTALQSGANQARTVLTEDANQAQESLSRLCQQTGRWIGANPFTSVGMAILVGAAMMLAGRSTRL